MSYSNICIQCGERFLWERQGQVTCSCCGIGHQWKMIRINNGPSEPHEFEVLCSVCGQIEQDKD